MGLGFRVYAANFTIISSILSMLQMGLGFRVYAANFKISKFQNRQLSLHPVYAANGFRV
jgi:hypothetical protein